VTARRPAFAVGDRIGSLVVLSEPTPSVHHYDEVRVRCDCGAEETTFVFALGLGLRQKQRCRACSRGIQELKRLERREAKAVGRVGRFCRECMGMPWRVTGSHCRVCGLARKEEQINHADIVQNRSVS